VLRCLPSQPRCKLLLTITPSLLPCARREVACAYIEEDADYATARRSLLEPLLLLPGVTWLGVLRGPALMELAATVRATWMAAYARAADTNAEGRAATANLELRTHAAGADVRLQLTSLLLKLHESAAPSRAHAHLGLFWLRAFDRFRQENTPKVQPRANAHHGARLLPLSLPPFALVQQPVPVVSCHDICGKEDRSVMAMVAGWAVFSLRGRMRGKKKYSKVRAA